MRNKRFIVLSVLAAAVLICTQAFAGKPPKPGTAADPRVVFLSSWEKISVANADGSNVTTVVSARKGRFHKPLMFPILDLNRRAILYHYEYPWLSRTLRITEFSVRNGVITVGATTDLGNLGAYAIHPDGTRIAFFDPAFPPPNMKIQELNLTTGVIRHLYNVPSGHDLHSFGGYTADARALVLIPYDLADPDLTSYDSIMVIDLDDSGVGFRDWDALDLKGWGNDLGGIEPAKASRQLLFDAENVLYILDLDALGVWPMTVGPGHEGTWAPDDSAVIYINNVAIFGPASKIDLFTGEISPFTNPRTSISEPHWR